MQDETRKPEFQVTSPAFREGESIPVRYTARGEDVSPELLLEHLSPEAKSLAVVLDDLSHPIFGVYCHWAIWNLPAGNRIPEGIPAGKRVPGLGAVQGIGYGRHRYKGPKPPRGTTHTYRFTVYALDCVLALFSFTGKQKLLSSLKGHILQKAVLTGTFQSDSGRI